MAKKPDKSDKPDADPPSSFEAAMQELEEIVRRMEAGQVPLDESLGLYGRGTFLIRHCQQRLDSAEKQIEDLSKNNNPS